MSQSFFALFYQKGKIQYLFWKNKILALLRNFQIFRKKLGKTNSVNCTVLLSGRLATVAAKVSKNAPLAVIFVKR